MKKEEGVPQSALVSLVENAWKIIVALGLLKALWNARSEDVPRIVEAAFQSSIIEFAGWIVALAIAAFATITIIFLEKKNKTEMERLTAERDHLQQHLLHSPVQHSGEQT